MTEPTELHLARIEAAGRLATDIPSCIHCRPVLEVLAVRDDLPRAVGVTHQAGCPVLQEWEDMPAVEGHF